MRRPTCPCGLPAPYDACCGPLHRGAAAESAERLMRSRYTAFALGDAAYLLSSWHPSTRPPSVSLDPGVQWTRLEVIEARGGLLDREGLVHFRAHSSAGVQAERSRFARDAGRWAYLDGAGLDGAQW